MDLLRWFRRGKVPPLLLLSNREPFVHYRGPDGAVGVASPVGGLTSALQPLMAATGGTWIAWGSGSADFDVVDEGAIVWVPPERPAYRLRRLRLSPDEVRQYYVETANRALWPLCHSQVHHFRYDADAWRTYRKVNQRFAVAAIAEAGSRPAIVWVHDYHLALVAGALTRVPNLFIHQFWHIPWPPADILRVLPTARELVRGLLGNDLLVFQTSRYRLNFLSGVTDLLPSARISLSRQTVRYRGHTTAVRACPISVDVAGFERLAARADTAQIARSLRKRYLPRGGQLVLGVDRIDYTKGIPQRLEAFARMLEHEPGLHGRVVFLQIAVPSRSEVPDYQVLEREVVVRVERINRRFRKARWDPIHLVRDHFDMTMLAACYRAADVCIVSSLQDGMNLVAKEFIACQRGGLGVLVLSRFAGAAEAMDGALLINPYDIDASAEALRTALTMKPAERELRLESLHRHLQSHTIGDWMDAIQTEVARLGRW